MLKLLKCVFILTLLVGFICCNHSANSKRTRRSKKLVGEKLPTDEDDLTAGREPVLAADSSASKLKEHGPLFIIAGTQKSGTTALAAFLSLHPNISMSYRKELHFFDKNANYKKGIEDYLEKFEGNHSTIIYGEATPFYIASRVACKRISAHFPKVKMIILLREPVSRAYSEYQMKARRVKEHEELVQLLTFHTNTVVQCMELHMADYKALHKCLPKAIVSHGRYEKFAKALKKTMTKWDDWSIVIEACFPLQRHSVYKFKNRRHLDLSNQQKTDTIYVNQTNSIMQSKMNVQPGRLFNAIKCWDNYKEGFETLQPLQHSFFEEIDSFLRCSSQAHLIATGNNVDMSLESQLQLLDEDIDKCIKIKGGISKQYIYRSIYAAQLFNCFKYIDQQQFLVLNSNSLKYDLRSTMERVLHFLDLPMDLAWLPNREEEDSILSAVVQSKFSVFEKTTSWRLQSLYDPIDEGIKQQLESFFLPYNNLLFELIAQNFTKLWYGDEVKVEV